MKTVQAFPFASYLAWLILINLIPIHSYQTILPSVLEQIVSCKDVIAQEYLMEVIIQVRWHTLEPFCFCKCAGCAHKPF